MFIITIVRPGLADYKQAVAYYNQQQYAKAIQELKPDLDQNSEWEFGHRLLGLCYLNLGNNALAISSLTRAIQLKSSVFSTYFGLGQAYYNLKKYENSISAFNQAELLASKEKDPEKEKAKLFRIRGTAYYIIGKYNDAVSDLTSAIRTNPSEWSDYTNLGISYFKLNRIDEAIQTLEKTLSMKPGQGTIIPLLGNAYLKKGVDALKEKKYTLALQFLVKGRDYDPNNGYIYYNLAEAYLFGKKYADAEKVLNRAVELMPKRMDVYERMGLVYEKQKKWDLALAAYKKAEEISPTKVIKDSITRVNENRKQ